MPASLCVRTDGYPSEDCVFSRDVDTDDADGIPPMEEKFCVMSNDLVVRMILVVDAESSSCLEQHLAADVMIAAPRTFIGRRDKFVLRSHLDRSRGNARVEPRRRRSSMELQQDDSRAVGSNAMLGRRLCKLI